MTSFLSNMFFLVLLVWSTIGIVWHLKRILYGSTQVDETSWTFLSMGFVFGLSASHLLTVWF